MTANPKVLRRYTDVPTLFYLLNRRVLTLVDPTSWDDKNDSYFLALYKRSKKLGALLAVCFTQANESYHHWRAFANGPGGICIQFDRLALIRAVSKHDRIRAKSVKYVTLKRIRQKPPSVRSLPFVKRYGYAHEQEFRVIYESPFQGSATCDIPISLDTIVRINLSPWIDPGLSKELTKVIKSLPGCSRLEVARSTLILNTEWRHLGEAVAKSDDNGTPAA